jgi:hypothetical protein
MIISELIIYRKPDSYPEANMIIEIQVFFIWFF